MFISEFWEGKRYLKINIADKAEAKMANAASVDVSLNPRNESELSVKDNIVMKP